MANYEETARTNYFRIKNREAFDKDFETIPGVEIWYDAEDPLLIGMGSYDGWPSFRCSDDEDIDDADIDIVDVVAGHLAEGEVAVFTSAGHEKLRFVGGFATAVNHEGRAVSISTNDIYSLAEKAFGVRPSAAEY